MTDRDKAVCRARHWFSTDRIGEYSQCILGDDHDGEHEDANGRWWAVFGPSMMEQPKPTPNECTAVVDMVVADLKDRDRVGTARYGVRLQPFNGRESLVDAYQESLDLALYIRQHLAERNALLQRAEAMRAVVEAALAWSDARCGRLSGCDPYDSTHDAECPTTLADLALIAKVNAYRNGAGRGGE